MESDWTFRCWNLSSFLHVNISNMSPLASDSILSFFFVFLIWSRFVIYFVICETLTLYVLLLFSLYAQWLSWVTVETSWVLSENILLMFIEIVLNLLVEHNKWWNRLELWRPPWCSDDNLLHQTHRRWAQSALLWTPYGAFIGGCVWGSTKGTLWFYKNTHI